MANTYTQLYVHVIFSVQGRKNLIAAKWRQSLYEYITGIIKNKNQKLMVINGVSDHLHLLIGLKPEASLSGLIRDVKANSSKWINDNGHVPGRFEWQSGFGAFSISSALVPTVVEYILNQEEHHRKRTFREEYIELLDAYQVEYRKEFIFKDYGGSTGEADGVENISEPR